MDQAFSRRSFIKAAGLASAGFALPWYACAPLQRPDFTVAFLTDIHVSDKFNSAEGFKKALLHVMAQPIKPDFVLCGGDLVYRTWNRSREVLDAHYDLFDKIVRENLDIPLHIALGNQEALCVHEDGGVDPDQPTVGKKYFMNRYGLEKTYKAFDHKGWTFALLDSVKTDNSGFTGGLDSEQIEWLAGELEARGKPTITVQHIPLFSNYREWHEGNSEPDNPRKTVQNAGDVTKAIDGKNVRLCLAGHLHINESWVYRGTEYANCGAVSGDAWEGPRDGVEEGYTLLEFYGDQVRHSYVDYGWEPPADSDEQAAG